MGHLLPLDLPPQLVKSNILVNLVLELEEGLLVFTDQFIKLPGVVAHMHFIYLVVEDGVELLLHKLQTSDSCHKKHTSSISPA